MRFTTSLLLALPALTLAQDQIPLGERLKGWFNKATASIQSAIPSVVPNPVDAGTSKIAEQVVYPINMSNWKDVLKPSSSTLGGPPEEWLIFFDGNKTCYNLCANASKAWNVCNLNIECPKTLSTYKITDGRDTYLRLAPSTETRSSRLR